MGIDVDAWEFHNVAGDRLKIGGIIVAIQIMGFLSVVLSIVIQRGLSCF
jgi:hypothetical protein